jgi:hypothetical protein
LKQGFGIKIFDCWIKLAELMGEMLFGFLEVLIVTLSDLTSRISPHGMIFESNFFSELLVKLSGVQVGN